MPECGRARADGQPCRKRTSGGPCRQHAAEIAPGSTPVTITPWVIDAPPAVTPREAAILALQASWSRWREYARLLEKQVRESKHNSGLVMQTWMVDADGVARPSGEYIRALAQLEAAERDRLTRTAKMCHDMGISVDD